MRLASVGGRHRKHERESEPAARPGGASLGAAAEALEGPLDDLVGEA
jgi:hypothetical protein